MKKFKQILLSSLVISTIIIAGCGNSTAKQVEELNEKLEVAYSDGDWDVVIELAEEY